MKKRLDEESKKKFWQLVKENDLSNSELARMLEVVPATITNWQTRDFVAIGALKKLEEALQGKGGEMKEIRRMLAEILHLIEEKLK